ncbi:MAG: long-chain fatty acid--CoA ligase [Thermoanaerobaculaceae bacterium]|nr:long-chain fatty acid--CoA ligase [Thermoanaerobaculaceae bacterium]TAM45171.1 MAG: long-chain fatty acid--CoA ligase [Acidobacteriota bacterium]
MSERSILEIFRQDVAAAKDHHGGLFRPGEVRWFSTRELLERTAALAEGLARLGVARGDRVMLMSENRPEWHMVDIAVLDLGAVDVPVYTTLTAAQIAFQVRDSGCRVAVADSAEHAATLVGVRRDCPGLEHVVQIEGAPADGARSFDEIVASGASADAVPRLWERAAAIAPDDLATIIYTSGTTGDPKGVTLTHRNFIDNSASVSARTPITGQELVLEFLPLCHVLERCAGYAYMRLSCARAYCGARHVAELLPVIRPVYFCSVPRVFEKVRDAVLTRVDAAPPARRRIFRWALAAGGRMARARLAGRRPGARTALAHAVADRLVFAKVRAALGGRVAYALSGGAPLPVDVNEFFHAIGIPIQEGYGLTETSPGIAVNGCRPNENRLGAVGRPLDNVEVRLADDGEILVRGSNVTAGYWHREDATREAFSPDGFFHTGDIGRFDGDGFLYVTDRKKDLIVTAGGKNVAPQPIEGLLKGSRFVDTAVLIGDGRPYIVALLSPDFAALRGWAAGQGITEEEPGALAAHPLVQALFREAVEAVNAELAHYEQVRRFHVLPVTLSIEGGQLTPTLKVRRRVVEREFSALVEAMYADEKRR